MKNLLFVGLLVIFSSCTSIHVQKDGAVFDYNRIGNQSIKGLEITTPDASIKVDSATSNHDELVKAVMEALKKSGLVE